MRWLKLINSIGGAELVCDLGANGYWTVVLYSDEPDGLPEFNPARLNNNNCTDVPASEVTVAFQKAWQNLKFLPQQLRPPVIALCACGCGKAPKRRSAYAEEACRLRAYRAKKKTPQMQKADPQLKMFNEPDSLNLEGFKKDLTALGERWDAIAAAPKLVEDKILTYLSTGDRAVHFADIRLACLTTGAPSDERQFKNAFTRLLKSGKLERTGKSPYYCYSIATLLEAYGDPSYIDAVATAEAKRKWKTKP